MVKINRSERAGGSFLTSSLAGLVLIGSVVLLVLYRNQLDLNDITVVNINTPTFAFVFSTQDNAAQVKDWRKHVRQTCAEAKTAEDVLRMEGINQQGFYFPVVDVPPKPQPRDEHYAVKRCRRVVMDFGANIGDTSGHVIDAGLLGCDRSGDLKTKTNQVHFNVETKLLENTKKRNPLTQNLIQLMKAEGALIGPEDYCYYGVEGNPVFTQRLQAIEDFVMAIRPRPIQHMHFFTESVGAGEDGMTKLYLDTVNKDVNFWGSSIFKDHQDVRKSNANSTEVVAADVMGRTIGTLMRQTLLAFDPAASPQDKKGNHLVLKVDIEGGEYPLLFQARQEGTLCEFVKMGNKADLYIEFHSQKVTGPHQYAGQVAGLKDDLTKCGVVFRNLAAWWA